VAYLARELTPREENYWFCMKALPLLIFTALVSLAAPAIPADGCERIHLIGAGWARLAAFIEMRSHDGILQNEALPQVVSKVNMLLPLSRSFSDEPLSDATTAIRPASQTSDDEVFTLTLLEGLVSAKGTEASDPNAIVAVIEKIASLLGQRADRCSCKAKQQLRFR
jgi:hypothetical protein